MNEPTCEWAPFEYPKRCGRPASQHVGQKHAFKPPPIEPKDDEIAYASAVTSWHCPFCGAYNDVHGEGALGSWMECTASCGKWAFLLSEYDEPANV